MKNETAERVQRGGKRKGANHTAARKATAEATAAEPAEVTAEDDLEAGAESADTEVEEGAEPAAAESVLAQERLDRELGRVERQSRSRLPDAGIPDGFEMLRVVFKENLLVGTSPVPSLDVEAGVKGGLTCNRIVFANGLCWCDVSTRAGEERHIELTPVSNVRSATYLRPARKDKRRARR